MPPEIITLEEGEEYTRNVDSWSIGVLMYIMLTGDVPFNGATKEELFENIVYKSVSSTLCHVFNIPIDMFDFLRFALEKDPETRFYPK